MSNTAINLVQDNSTVVNDLVEKIDELQALEQRRIVAESASRSSYKSELENAESIGAKRGRAMARKALLAGIPTDINEFHIWANK